MREAAAPVLRREEAGRGENRADRNGNRSRLLCRGCESILARGCGARTAQGLPNGVRSDGNLHTTDCGASLGGPVPGENPSGHGESILRAARPSTHRGGAAWSVPGVALTPAPRRRRSRRTTTPVRRMAARGQGPRHERAHRSTRLVRPDSPRLTSARTPHPAPAGLPARRGERRPVASLRRPAGRTALLSAVRGRGESCHGGPTSSYLPELGLPHDADVAGSFAEPVSGPTGSLAAPPKRRCHAR
ncbi:hypothetical protein SAMN05216482_3374 [Streptomyces sp. PAN_FS17]|nr:hypothetical protein SAMN05216482_3374 [Streptomyces sp. PAN_FS17]